MAGLIQLLLSGRQAPDTQMNSADRTDWWAAAIQFAGTLLFNASTGAALVAAIIEPDRVGAGWRPDAWGSIAFLVSSVLAVIATKDRRASSSPLCSRGDDRRARTGVMTAPLPRVTL